MIKKYIPVIFITSFLLSQSIIHSPITTLEPGKPFNVEASIIGLTQDQSDLKMTLFYRSSSQQTYFNSSMTYINGSYRYSIPASFVNRSIEYFILLEIENGGVIGFPQNDPKENPIIAISNSSKQYNVNQNPLLYPQYTILFPEENSNVIAEDVLISLSYFMMDDVNSSKTKIYINNIDYTADANIQENHFILIPNNSLESGSNTIKVVLTNNFGSQYKPIVWTFNVIGENSKKNQQFILSQSGNIQSNYNNSFSDGILLDVGQFSGDYNLDLDWLKIKTNFLLSSLEEVDEQTRNRISFDFKSAYFNIKLGDSYPSFSEYTINGNRIRGINLNYKNKFLNFNFLSGKLVRATQGLAKTGAMLLLENQSPIFQANGFLDQENIGVIDVSRNNYAFDQSLLGMNAEFSISNKFKFKLEFLKIKDRIQSVDQVVDNSFFSLPETMVRHLYSDMFVDYNDNGLYDDGEFIGNLNEESHDVVGSTDWDDIDSSLININMDNFISHGISIVNIGTFTEEPYTDTNLDGEFSDGEFYNDIDLDGEWSNDISYNVLQKQWSFTVRYEDLQDVINDFIVHEEMTHTNEEEVVDMSDCVYNNCFGNYSINMLADQWEGVKPQDNIVLLTDFTHNLDDGAFKINYGLGFSMLNQNIWNPSLTYESLDALGAEDSTEENDGMFNGAPIPDIVNNLEDFENVFQTGTSQVPIIPVVISSDGSVKLSDILTLPSAAVYFDVTQKYFGHRISFGFRQVGAEYNTLGNPYVQTDVREQYFSDRTYLLDNKLSVLFKWKRVEDGIAIDQDNGQTDKYDLNFGFYPGANLPTYNLAVGIYNRTNGIDPIYNPILIVTDDVNGNGEVDTLDCHIALADDYICNEDEEALGYMIEDSEALSTQLYQPEKTRTRQFNLSINSSLKYIYEHKINVNMFYSSKRDLVDINKYLELNSDYYSPRAMTQSYNLGVRTTYSKKIESSFILNYNYYDYGYATNSHPEYFQFQKITTFDISLSYDTESFFGRISPGVNLSIGRGNTKFSQFALKTGVQAKIIENLRFNMNMNYKIKSVDSEVDFGNYSFTADLKYRF